MNMTPHPRSNLALVLSSVAAGLAVFSVLTVVWVLTTQRSERLCSVLYSLVARSGATIGKPGTPGYAYYHSHPAELRVAREQNQDFLDALGCTLLGKKESK